MSDWADELVAKIVFGVDMKRPWNDVQPELVKLIRERCIPRERVKAAASEHWRAMSASSRGKDSYHNARYWAVYELLDDEPPKVEEQKP